MTCSGDVSVTSVCKARLSEIMTTYTTCLIFSQHAAVYVCMGLKTLTHALTQSRTEIQVSVGQHHLCRFSSLSLLYSLNVHGFPRDLSLHWSSRDRG